MEITDCFISYFYIRIVLVIMPMIQCTKCGSTQIDKGEIVRTGAPKGSIGYWSHTKRGLFPTSGAIESYVCIQCGYMESYFIDILKLK